jgi:ABC-type transporter Mla MlaB component
MLRITAIESRTSGTALRLEGRLAGPWVHELARACEAALDGNGSLSLDLEGTSFVDAGGVALLGRLRERRVTVVNCSPFVAEQLKRP